jgi:hypothetical protein
MKTSPGIWKCPRRTKRLQDIGKQERWHDLDAGLRWNPKEKLGLGVILKRERKKIHKNIQYFLGIHYL